MPVTPSSYDALQRMLLRGITVGSVAESLVSLDAGTDREEYRRIAESRGFDVIGARAEGVVMGYVEPTASDDVRFVAAEQVLPDDAPLHTGVVALDAFPRVFVATLGGISGIVTRDDVEKPPGRMWVFGIVTLLETALRRIVAARHPDDGWTEVLSEGRTEMARALHAERARRGEDVELLDCLQFGDLASLAARHEDVRSTFGHASRREAEKRMKEWAGLRNRIAHSQAFVRDDWGLLARVAANADRGGLQRLLDTM